MLSFALFGTPKTVFNPFFNKILLNLTLHCFLLEMKNKIIVLLGFCLLLLLPSYGQKLDSSYFEEPITTNKIDRSKWESIVKGTDYTEIIEEKEEVDCEEKEESSDWNFALIGYILKFLIIGLGIGLIVFILVKVLSADSLFAKKDKNISGKTAIYDLEEIEENLLETELDGSIQKAIQDGNYALAIRLYYLSIIRELSLAKALDWKKEKTNFQYLRELQNHPLKDSFKNATKVFERIWYGEEELPVERFRAIAPDFEQLLKASRKPV